MTDLPGGVVLARRAGRRRDRREFRDRRGDGVRAGAGRRAGGAGGARPDPAVGHRAVAARRRAARRRGSAPTCPTGPRCTGARRRRPRRSASRTSWSTARASTCGRRCGRCREEHWDLMMAVNLTAPFLLGQRFGPAMAARGWGRIINVTSQQAQRAFGNSGGYGASKGGLAALTRSQSEAWASSGVCVNSVCPGFVATPLNGEVSSDPVRSAALAARTMTGSNGEPSDFAGVAGLPRLDRQRLRHRPDDLRRRRLLRHLAGPVRLSGARWPFLSAGHGRMFGMAGRRGGTTAPPGRVRREHRRHRRHRGDARLATWSTPTASSTRARSPTPATASSRCSGASSTR